MYYKTVILRDGSAFNVEFLDMAGFDKLTTLGDLWIREGDIFVLCVPIYDYFTSSASNKGSVKSMEELLNKIERIREDNNNYCVVIVGTKVDLRCEDSKLYGNKKPEKDNFNDFNDFLRIVKERKLCYIETSAKDGINVKKLLDYCLWEYWFQSCVLRKDRV